MSAKCWDGLIKWHKVTLTFEINGTKLSCQYLCCSSNVHLLLKDWTFCNQNEAVWVKKIFMDYFLFKKKKQKPKMRTCLISSFYFVI